METTTIQNINTIVSEQLPWLTATMKEYFNRDVPQLVEVDSSNLNGYNSEFNFLVYIPLGMTPDEVFEVYANSFKKDKVYCYYYLQNQPMQQNILKQEERPEKDRFLLCQGNEEPDKVHRGKSYNDFSKEKISYMIPIEGIMFAFLYRLKTGNMIDVKGITKFHALDFDGDVMGMCRDHDGMFNVSGDNFDDRNGDYGPREIILL